MKPKGYYILRCETCKNNVWMSEYGRISFKNKEIARTYLTGTLTRLYSHTCPPKSTISRAFWALMAVSHAYEVYMVQDGRDTALFHPKFTAPPLPSLLEEHVGAPAPLPLLFKDTPGDQIKQLALQGLFTAVLDRSRYVFDVQSVFLFKKSQYDRASINTFLIGRMC